MKLDYMQRLMLGVMALEKQFPKGVVGTFVSHDDDCAMNKAMKCSCVPDIHIEISDKIFDIDEEGVLHERSD